MAKKTDKQLIMCKNLILVAVCSILLQARAFAAQASDETIAVYKAAIEAFKAVEHPLTGIGSASAEIYHRKRGATSQMVDFMFKGDLSRSTKFSVKEGKRGQPELLWAVGEKSTVIYNYTQGFVVVQRQPQSQFNHKLGYDFNPDTFMLWYSTPLTVHTERLLNGPATLSTSMDNEGILHLITNYKDPNTVEHFVMSVDPAKGYRLVRGLSVVERFDKPDYSYTDFLEIQWDKYGSSWYAKTAKFASYAGAHSPEERASLGADNLVHSTSVTVTEFHPNVEISNSEFTLNGLGLPIGTRVMDRISGRNYKIDSSPQRTDIPQKPLLEAESDKSVKNQVDIKDVKQDTTAIGERAESEKKTSISTEESAQESRADTLHHQHKHRNFLIIIALFVGIILITAIGWRLLTRIK